MVGVEHCHCRIPQALLFGFVDDLAEEVVQARDHAVIHSNDLLPVLISGALQTMLRANLLEETWHMAGLIGLSALLSRNARTLSKKLTFSSVLAGKGISLRLCMENQGSSISKGGCGWMAGKNSTQGPGGGRSSH